MSMDLADAPDIEIPLEERLKIQKWLQKTLEKSRKKHEKNIEKYIQKLKNNGYSDEEIKYWAYPEQYY